MDRFSKARDIKNRRNKGETIGKSRQSRMNDERLYFRFIGKYVEGLHPTIFADAVAFHKETKQKNPGVNDCTKTVEFVSRVMPNTPIPRHYYRRQKRPQTQEIMLQIPLLTNEQTLAIMTTTSLPEPQPVSTPLPEPQPVSAPLSEPQPVSAPLPEPQPVSAPLSEPQTVSPPLPLPELPPVSEPLPLPELPPVSELFPLPELPPVSEPLPLPELPPVSEPFPSQLPELPPEIYIDMLKDIQLDPQLNQIFNDFQEDDVGMDDIVRDDISEHNVQMF